MGEHPRYARYLLRALQHSFLRSQLSANLQRVPSLPFCPAPTTSTNSILAGSLVPRTIKIRTPCHREHSKLHQSCLTHLVDWLCYVLHRINFSQGREENICFMRVGTEWCGGEGSTTAKLARAWQALGGFLVVLGDVSVILPTFNNPL